MVDKQEKARIAWHCRRGMLELDLILNRFLEKHLDKISHEELKSFNRLLNYTDPELFAWLMGHNEPEDIELKKIVAFIQSNH